MQMLVFFEFAMFFVVVVGVVVVVVVVVVVGAKPKLLLEYLISIILCHFKNLGDHLKFR